MKSMQINFIIPSEMECDFFNYIINRCDCKIYRRLINEHNKTFMLGERIEDFCYFIKPNSVLDEVVYKKSEESMDVMEIYPFDENFNLFPFIQYERSMGEDIKIPFRLYVSQNIEKKHKTLLKETYKKLCEWIKLNSVMVEKDDGYRLYHLSN